MPLIRDGNYVETAAAIAGIAKNTFYDWVRQGARLADRLDKGEKLWQKEMRLVDFSYAVKKATAESEASDLAKINKAASDGAWQAAAWRLERRFPNK